MRRRKYPANNQIGVYAVDACLDVANNLETCRLQYTYFMEEYERENDYEGLVRWMLIRELVLSKYGVDLDV